MLIYMLIKVCLLSMFVITMYIRRIKYLVASDDLCHLLKPFANSFGADRNCLTPWWYLHVCRYFYEKIHFEKQSAEHRTSEKLPIMQSDK